MFISSLRSFTPAPVFFLRNHLSQNLPDVVSPSTRYLPCDIISDRAMQARRPQSGPPASSLPLVSRAFSNLVPVVLLFLSRLNEDLLQQQPERTAAAPKSVAPKYGNTPPAIFRPMTSCKLHIYYNVTIVLFYHTTFASRPWPIIVL